MAPPQAFMTASSFLGIGVESVRGTVAAAFTYLPVESPQVTPDVTWLEDKGFRGSALDLYNDVPGPHKDMYEAKGNVFLDSFPNLLRAVLGSTDTTTASPASTTLAALASAGATTVSSTATIPVGSAIVIDTVGGPLAETHFVTNVTGSGPFTLTLDKPLIFGHANAAPVTGLTAHKIGLLYNLATAHQPPSYSINDFDGVSTKQILGAQADELNLTFGADAAFAWSTKFIGNPFAVVGNPTQAFSSEIFVPGYSVEATVGGTQMPGVQSGEINMKRATEAIFTAQGVNSPLVNFAGPFRATGKLTLVVLSGDTTLTAGTTYLKNVIHLGFTEPTTNHSLDLQMSQVQYDSPKISRGKTYVEIDVQFKAEGNATDSTGTGYASVLSRVANGISTVY